MAEVLRWAGWAALGAVCGWAYLPGAPVAWAPWLVIAPLFHAAWRMSPAAAFRRGWVYGTAGWAVGMHWFPPTVALFLGVSPAVAALLFIVACAACGLGWGALAAAAACVPPRRGNWPAWLAAAGAAVCLDAWFPELWEWYLGTGQVAYPVLAQAAAFGGTGALSWLIGGVNAGLALAFFPSGGETRVRPLLASLAVLALTAAAGAVRLATLERAAGEAQGLRVLLLHGDLPPRLEEPESNVGDLTGYAAKTAAALAEGGADLVVWPESAFPGRVTLEPSGAWVGEKPFGQVLGERVPPGPPLLLGAITERGPVGGRQRRYNSALYADERRDLVGWVDKAYLIPFGEFMPLGRLAPWLRRLSPATWSLGRGRGAGVVDGPLGSRLGALICYEDVVPERSRRMARAGASLLVNITNESWFTPAAQESHFLFSRLRAVETGLPFVRAANVGVTAFVDAAGRVRARLPTSGGRWLRADVPGGGRPAPGLALGDALFILGALAYVSGAAAGFLGRPP